MGYLTSTKGNQLRGLYNSNGRLAWGVVKNGNKIPFKRVVSITSAGANKYGNIANQQTTSYIDLFFWGAIQNPVGNKMGQTGGTFDLSPDVLLVFFARKDNKYVRGNAELRVNDVLTHNNKSYRIYTIKSAGTEEYLIAEASFVNKI